MPMVEWQHNAWHPVRVRDAQKASWRWCHLSCVLEQVEINQEEKQVKGIKDWGSSMWKSIEARENRNYYIWDLVGEMDTCEGEMKYKAVGRGRS